MDPIGMTLNRFLLLQQMQGTNMERPKEISLPRWRAMVRSARHYTTADVMVGSKYGSDGYQNAN